MQTQNGGRPTILPKMYEEPLLVKSLIKLNQVATTEKSTLVCIVQLKLLESGEMTI